MDRKHKGCCVNSLDSGRLRTLMFEKIYLPCERKDDGGERQKIVSNQTKTFQEYIENNNRLSERIV